MKWVVFNQKGGVGKSTLVSNLAAIAAEEGERSLVVDLDPQGCSSHKLSGELRQLWSTPGKAARGTAKGAGTWAAAR